MTDELRDHLHTSRCARLIRSRTEKSLWSRILDLIISWEAEHCENYTRQTEELRILTTSWMVFLLSVPDCFSVEIHHWVRHTSTVLSLHFVPSVKHGALLTQSADPGTEGARHLWNNCHRNLSIYTFSSFHSRVKRFIWKWQNSSLVMCKSAGKEKSSAVQL